MGRMNVSERFKKFSCRDAFEGAQGPNAQELLNIVKGKPSNRPGYYAICSSGDDRGFYPIKLTKWQAEVYGREAFLSTIQLYLSKLFPNNEDDIQVHARQLIPMSQLNVPEELKENAKKRIDSLSETYKKGNPNTRIERIKHLKSHTEDSYLYLVMKAKSTQKVDGEPLVVKLPYQKVLELSLTDDFSGKFLTFSEIQEMFENNHIPRFVSVEEQELRNFIWNDFLTGKNFVELADPLGQHIWVKVATDEKRRTIKKKIGEEVCYGYIMKASESSFPFFNRMFAKKKVVYSSTSPMNIIDGLTQGIIGRCASYAESLVKLFSYTNYLYSCDAEEDINLGEITVGSKGDFEYGIPSGRQKSIDVKAPKAEESIPLDKNDHPPKKGNLEDTRDTREAS